MTPDEIRAEWEFRYDERIAILCGQNEPTIEQRRLAMNDADEWERNFTRNNETV